MSKFIDEVVIEVRAGDGGNGMVAWRKEKYEPMGGPYGGDGGDGGDIIFEANPNYYTLYDFTYKANLVSPEGKKGGSKKKTGARGSDLIVPVPVGTVITCLDTQRLIADLNKPYQKVIVAQGGRGGKGNASLASMKNKAPHYAYPGEPGEYKNLKLELKTIADIGIMGMPNAGKSTLLSKLTNAKPKIANYPFSTLNPNLGVANCFSSKITFADIPGLIKGASQGLGLGHSFLKHIERTKFLVHIVDLSDTNYLNNVKDFFNELISYNESFNDKDYILVFNKIDLVDKEMISTDFNDTINKFLVKNKIKKPFELVYISAYAEEGISQFVEACNKLLIAKQNVKQELPVFDVYEIGPVAVSKPKNEFEIFYKNQNYYVSGEFINRHLQVTNLRDPESVQHFNNILKKYGVMKKLEEMGIKPEDNIVINEIVFTYLEDLF